MTRKRYNYGFAGFGWINRLRRHTSSVASDGTFMIDGGAMKGTALQDGSMIAFDDDDPADGYISAAVGIK